MLNLSNLKAGQSKTVDVDGTDLTVVKVDGGYDLIFGVSVATLSYDKDAKVWVLLIAEDVRKEFTATAKTVLDQVIAYWGEEPEAEVTPEPEPEHSQADEEPEPEAKPHPVATEDDVKTKKMDAIAKAIALANDPSASQGEAEAALARVAALMDKYDITDEDLRRRKAATEGTQVEDENIVAWEYDVNVLGGHALHRVAAFHSVVKAMGAGVFYRHHKPKGLGYKHHIVTLHVIAQSSVVDNLKIFLPMMEVQMERLGEQVSKRVSHEARLAGGHHSGPGCHARRGFFRGFGSGIASRVATSREETVSEDTSGSKALVVRDRAAQVDSYMAQHYPKLKNTKAQKFDGAAWGEGYVAGVAFVSPQIAADERESINA